jgi:hypothetical protein
MTNEIKKIEWKDFFDRVSRELVDWETSVQILNADTGAQVLSSGLPFNGITFDDKHENGTIEFSIGNGTENHQTHNIPDPLKVAFEPSSVGLGGTLDIEDASGTKTLISFLRSMPMFVQYVAGEMISVNR